jgi:DNA-directed RNA polymerase subunit alpha
MEYQIALPSKPRVVKEAENTAVFEIDGLFPGYGHTLGNSLRRVVLSSLSGVAITAVKIDGVDHEFSTVEGVREDVLTILLNLKRVRFTATGEDPIMLSLSAKGACEVTAQDIKTGGNAEVLNPEQPIATLTAKNASLSMEITIERGIGYLSREMRKEDKAPIGTIFLDAAFSPIRRVNYEVENMRVGDRTDYNRLRMFIETDGTLAPREALERSIETMIHQLKAVVGFKEPVVEEMVFEEQQEAKQTLRPLERPQKDFVDADVLKTRIESLKLGARTISALTNANIRTVGGIARKKEEDILAIEGLGIKGLQEIKRALSEFGITLR